MAQVSANEFFLAFGWRIARHGGMRGIENPISHRFASCEALAAALLLLTIAGCTSSRHVDQPVEQRLDALAAEVENARQVSARAVEPYTPKSPTRIDDPDVSRVPMLQHLPGVVSVETLVKASKPTHRIIHLRDFHHVPRDLYAVDLRNSTDKPLSEAEIDQLHRELLLQVELVSLQHESLLRCLIKHHGLRRVLCEGLSQEGVGEFKEVIGTLRKLDRDLAGLRRSRAELKGDAEAIDKELNEMQAGLQEQLRPYGVLGRLAMEEAVEVLPLEDERLLQAAKPVRPDGQLKLDPADLAARHDAQVKTALASDRVSFIVLGASHDLSESVRKLGGGNVEYMRVTTKTVQRFVGEE